MPHRSARAQKPKKSPTRLHIERGAKLYSFALRGWFLGGVLGLFLFLFGWAAIATTYILMRDDVLVGLFNRYIDMQFAYEDRLSSMRMRVDQLAGRQLIDQEAFEAKLADVMSRQSKLETRHASVAALVAEVQGKKRTAQDVSDITGSLNPSRMRDHTLGRLIDGVTDSVARLENTQEEALDSLEKVARRDTDRVRRALSELGLNAHSILSSSTGKNDARGGPFVPLVPEPAPHTLLRGHASLHSDDATPDAFEVRMQQTRASLDEARQARRVMHRVPLRRPMSNTEITSTFGSRLDPFLGTWAMHAGIDFRGETGTPVYATARGRVAEAGWSGGYGQMVEIDHGHGMSTRFGHLSAILVAPGQSVEPGQMIGRVGSTGRSTGPHLHYETRIDDGAVDPIRFLRAGERLAVY